MSEEHMAKTVRRPDSLLLDELAVREESEAAELRSCVERQDASHWVSVYTLISEYTLPLAFMP